MSKNTTSVASLSDLTDAQRKSLAAAIVKERTAGRSWDGDNGICNDARFPLIKTATQGRKLLKEAGKASMIAKSYDRAAYNLKGPRTAKATVAKKATPKATPKATAKKTVVKRTRKPAAK